MYIIKNKISTELVTCFCKLARAYALNHIGIAVIENEMNKRYKEMNMEYIEMNRK